MKRTTGAIAFSASLALLLAGCGGEAEDTANDATSAVEDAAGEVSLTTPGLLTLTQVHRAGSPEPERLLVEALAATELPAGRLSAFVHGEAESIRAVRRHLLDQGVVSADQLSCSPYWRRGHTDEQWRSIKKDWVRAMHAETS